MTEVQRVLVTGATGYIGGSLAPHLLQAGYPVRVMVHNPDRLKGRWWAEQVEVAVGDALKPETLSRVLEGSIPSTIEPRCGWRWPTCTPSGWTQPGWTHRPPCGETRSRR